jgi:hypothetical protein
MTYIFNKTTLKDIFVQNKDFIQWQIKKLRVILKKK